MSLYRGHITAGIAIATGVLSVLLVWAFFMNRSRIDDWADFLLLMATMLAIITALTCSALAYAWWVPKWERDEKRTGHVPGH